MANVGHKIQIIYMRGEPHYQGRVGEIEIIDCAGQLHGTWGECALIPEIDKYEIIEKD